jgi:hypothetical protein
MSARHPTAQGGDTAFLDIQGYMSCMGHTRPIKTLAAAEKNVMDVEVDMTSLDNEVCQSTAFRLSALALAQAAIDASLLFDTMPSGVKRELMVADPELAIEVVDRGCPIVRACGGACGEPNEPCGTPGDGLREYAGGDVGECDRRLPGSGLG